MWSPPTPATRRPRETLSRSMILPGARASLRRLIRDRRRTGAVITAALIGDSITLSCRRPAGDWFDLADPACRYRVTVNASRGGDTTQEMKRHLGLVLRAEPDVCIVQGGGNDIVAGRTTAEIVADLDTIYHTLTKGGVEVIATTILPHGDTPSDRLADIDAVNRFVLGAHNVTACDWTTTLIDEDGWLCRDYADDGTHPNPDGVAIMGARLAPVLAKAATRLTVGDDEGVGKDVYE